MIKYKKEMQPKDVIEDVICDLCHKSCKVEIASGYDAFEYATLKWDWGYASNLDGLAGQSEICQDCCTNIATMNKMKKENFIDGKADFLKTVAEIVPHPDSKITIRDAHLEVISDGTSVGTSIRVDGKIMEYVKRIIVDISVDNIIGKVWVEFLSGIKKKKEEIKK